MTRTLSAAITWVLLTFSAPAAEPAAPSYEREIAPLLQSRCGSCHGDGPKTKGDLNLRARELILRGGENGPALIPGKPDQSLLLQRVRSGEMPAGGKEKLSAAEIDLLARWIAAGAPGESSADSPAAPKEVFWSLKPPVRPVVPQMNSNRGRNPIDAFVLRTLETKNLSFAPESDPATLIRRLYFDLIGLPPPPEAIAAFVADHSGLAYERLVDQLLASPAYGERWARHWLDIVRFAESDGFETNLARQNAWPYRDYVIKAFNDNLPFDRFVTEQLAGDALGADVATGFLVAGAYDQVKSPDIVLTRQQRADELHDIVSTVGSTFLGLTIGCARCHHHKFDPITHSDYYAVKAIFAGVHHGERSIETAGAKRTRLAQLEELRHELTKLDEQRDLAEPLADPHAPAGHRRMVNARRNVERFEPVKAKFIRFTITATTEIEPCIDELEVFAAGAPARNVALASLGVKATASGTYVGSDRHKLEHVNDGHYGNERSWISNENGRGWVQLELPEPQVIDRVVWARDREAKYRDRLPTAYRIEVALEPGDWKLVAGSADRLPYSRDAKRPPTTDPLELRRRELEKEIEKAERPPSIYAGTFLTPEPTFRLHRGDPMQEREPIAPGGVAAIGPPLKLSPNVSDRDRRLALARWIVDPANPLAARVMVNRLWQHHFGRGLVETPGDFGEHGGRPSHPQLLDWLAVEFVSSGWDIKHVQRLMVLSATYRQSSKANPAGLAADAQDRLLWRFPPQRLEAETIRDAILAVSGVLDRRMGGPGFDLFEPNSNYVKVYTPKRMFGPAEWRRMIYQSRPRMQPDDTFGAFDCPDAGQIAPRRTVSTTPLQALNLLNSPFMMQQADLFAERLRREGGEDATGQIHRAFWLAYGRGPAVAEEAAAKRLIGAHGLPAFCRALFNANEFLFVN